jgi:hypothetical protein
MENCAVEHKGCLVYYHYMNWIEERLGQRRVLMERTRLIVEHTPKIYQAVWDEILVFVKDGQAAGMALSTGGSVSARVVRISSPGEPNLDRELTVGLSGDKLTGYALGLMMCFDFDVCGDGVVCLKHEGARVSEREAARLLLDPFLFPELVK